MNNLEKKLVLLINRMKARNHILGIKAEFEAEGTRSDELLRLLAIISQSNLPLTLKIGGCEAKKDLYEARQFGASCIVAPMIESEYALMKFIDTVSHVYPNDEQNEVEFYFNIETIQAYKNIEKILDVADNSDLINGIVFGRTDFSKSINITNGFRDEKVTQSAKSIALKIKESDLKFTIGGNISITSIDILKEIAEIKLTKFETRKVIFSADSLNSNDLDKSLLDAVHFEILWLQNKRNYYQLLQSEDEERINTLEKRLGVLEREIEF